MARYPAAAWKPLPENARQRRITPRAFILHTAVDGRGDTDLEDYFRRGDVGAESHFWVPFRKPLVQMMDTAVEANANRVADRWAISAETEDDSAGKSHIAPWNDKQIREIIDLIEWAIRTHNIPRRACESAYLPGAAGIGYHSMPMRERFDGTANNPWTSYQGKTCPGDARVQQFYDVILPAVLAGGDESQEDDDMPYSTWPQEDKDALLRDIRKALLYDLTGSAPDLSAPASEWTNHSDLANDLNAIKAHLGITA